MSRETKSGDKKKGKAAVSSALQREVLTVPQLIERAKAALAGHGEHIVSASVLAAEVSIEEPERQVFTLQQLLEEEHQARTRESHARNNANKPLACSRKDALGSSAVVDALNYNSVDHANIGSLSNTSPMHPTASTTSPGPTTVPDSIPQPSARQRNKALIWSVTVSPGFQTALSNWATMMRILDWNKAHVIASTIQKAAERNDTVMMKREFERGVHAMLISLTDEELSMAVRKLGQMGKEFGWSGAVTWFWVEAELAVKSATSANSIVLWEVFGVH